MTPEIFAQHLNGIDMRDGIPQQCIEQAREAGLVIVYGASDDLIEFDGAIYDEYGVFDGDIIKFDREGIIPEWETIEKEVEQEVRDYFKRVDNTEASEILVKESHGLFYWSYDTDIPHAKFQMLEDGEPYCEGIVFSVKDMKGF